jgi:hypothetical protein
MGDRDFDHRNGKPFRRDDAGKPFTGKPFRREMGKNPFTGKRFGAVTTVREAYLISKLPANVIVVTHCNRDH